jgi:NTE family protein
MLIIEGAIMQRLDLQFEGDSVTYAAESPPFENLVLEGGGERGIVYPGAAQVLEDQGVLKNLKRIGGTSAGSLSAVVIGLGYSATEFTQIAMNLKGTDLVDTTPTLKAAEKFLEGDGVLAGANALKKVKEIVRNKIAAALVKHPDLEALFLDPKTHKVNLDTITFRHVHEMIQRYPDLGMKELFLTGTNKSDKKLKIFSYDDSPDMEIAEAARISMSIPVIYQTIEKDGKVYEDGGCLDNFPMDIFDQKRYLPASPYCLGENKQNLCTLGLKVDTKENMEYLIWHNQQAELDAAAGNNPFKKIKNKIMHAVQAVEDSIENKLFDAITGVAYTKASADEVQRDRTLYEQRMIQIYDNDVNTADFFLKPEAKQKMIENGKQATQQWLSEHHGELRYIAAAKNFPALVAKLATEDLAHLCATLKSNAINMVLANAAEGVNAVQNKQAECVAIAENQYRERLLEMKKDPNKAEDVKKCQAIYEQQSAVKPVVMSSSNTAVCRQLNKAPDVKVAPTSPLAFVQKQAELGKKVLEEKKVPEEKKPEKKAKIYIIDTTSRKPINKKPIYVISPQSTVNNKESMDIITIGGKKLSNSSGKSFVIFPKRVLANPPQRHGAFIIGGNAKASSNLEPLDEAKESKCKRK